MISGLIFRNRVTASIAYPYITNSDPSAPYQSDPYGDDIPYAYPQYPYSAQPQSTPPTIYPEIAYELPYVQAAGTAQLMPTASFPPLQHSLEKNSAEFEIGICAL